MMRVALAALAAGTLAACAPSLAGTAATPHGRMVIIGGGLSDTTGAVYRAVLDGRSGSGPLCIIPTAGGGDPARTIAGAVETFERWGGAGAAVGIPISTARPGDAADSTVVRQLRTCSGFYFTGGVQSRIATVFRPRGVNTPAYDAVMARFRAGAVVAGSSAGAAIMSDPMIAAGSTTGALEHGITRHAAELDEAEDAPAISGVSITPGMGFLRNAIVDQHFLARGRIGRLITAVLDLEEYDLGFGIDENTALVIDGRRAHVVGESGVVVIDARDAQRSSRSATGVKLHLISTGDRFDMAARTAVIAPAKRALPASTDSVAVPDNVFARWQFLHLVERWARTPARELRVPVPGGALLLRKGTTFSAAAGDGAGVENTPAGLSITGLVVDVRR
jgi:cyanophycinase